MNVASAPRALLLPALFLVSGLVVAVVSGRSPADGGAHLGIVAAAAVFLTAGTVLERLLGLGADGRLFPFHRLALGQVALILYFSVRSVLSHGLGLPGVSSAELLTLAALLLGLLAWQQSRGAPQPTPEDRGGAVALALLWTLWWVSTFVFLGVRSGELATPCSDTDVHAFLARLTAGAGLIPYDNLPYSTDPLIYPSAFGNLNALWILLSGVTPVQIVNLQVALQACLTVGLILEVLFALRRRVPVGGGLLVLAAAHWIFTLPANSERPFLDGTPRLAHTALALLPLTFALRLRAARGPIGRRLWAAVFVLAVCAAWAVTTNPAHLLVMVPVAAATVVVGWTLWRIDERGPATDRGRHHWIALATIVFPVLLVATDAWLPTLFEPRPIVEVVEPAPPPNFVFDASTVSSVARWAEDFSVLGVLPTGCFPGPHCPPYLGGVRWWAPVLAYPLALGGLILAARRRRQTSTEAHGWPDLELAAAGVLAVGVATWTGIVLNGLMEGILPRPHVRDFDLLREYTVNGVRYLVPVLFLLLGTLCLAAGSWVWHLVAVRRGWRLPADLVVTAAVLVAGLVLWGRNPTIVAEAGDVYRRNATVIPPPSLGPIEEADLEFLGRAADVVPPGERVLLPGIVTLNRFEVWNFALGPSRALPLYSDLHFAFFFGLGPSAASAPAYRDRVCQEFDLPWLREELAVKWVFVSGGALDLGACLFNWEDLRDDYFEERLRVGDRALYRVRDSLARDPAEDPRLRPIEAPAPGLARGRGVKGFLEGCHHEVVEGWACDEGAETTVAVAFEVRDGEEVVARSLHRANRAREPEVSRRCGTRETDHGFRFTPPEAPAGTYEARLMAWDGLGETAEEVASCTYTVPLRGPRAPRAGTGQGVRGYVDACLHDAIQGWACDATIESPVMVELRITDGAAAWRRTFFLADKERRPVVAGKCETSTARHGFDFKPPRLPPGAYQAMILAYDGDGEGPRELRSCTLYFPALER